MEEPKERIGISEKVIRDVFTCLRGVLFSKLMSDNANTLLGGPGKVVCIDETFITIKKRISIWIFWKAHLCTSNNCDGRNRTWSVNAFLHRKNISPNYSRSKKTDISVGDQWVCCAWRGDMDDSHRSCCWLARRGPWSSVCCSDKEFSREEDGRIISTNAMEGLFSRQKNVAPYKCD